MIYLVEIEEGYFLKEVTDCGRYYIKTKNLAEAEIFNTYEQATKIIETWDGNIITYETD